MLKTILHQIWNQRRQNGWIFIELLVVSFFLWVVIDPIALLTGYKLIPRGYEAQGRYAVRMEAYDETHADWQMAEDSASHCKAAFERIISEIRHLPEVEYFSISGNAAFPNAPSFNGGSIRSDTTEHAKKMQIQEYDFVGIDGSNLFATYGMKDARTNKDFILPEDCADKRFISESIAREFWGTTDVIGKEFAYDDQMIKVSGVFKEYKHRDYEKPTALIVHARSGLFASKYMHYGYVVTFKLKQGVDAEAFEKRFHQEVAPRLRQGNFYMSWLKPFEQLSDEYAIMSGSINKLRLQYGLAVFALLSIFLGMLGTFWIRCNARRQEIGVMRSMGASQIIITRQFLFEATLLVTVAFVIALLVVFNYVRMEGMAGGVNWESNQQNAYYWMNRFGIHFAIVSIVTYLTLLLTALLGTYIPVYRASRVNPAEALRDE